jgi:twitching motility protein PilT
VKEKVVELQEDDGSYSVPGAARFRVAVYRQRGSLAVVLRIIPPQPPTIDGLGLPAVLKKIASYERSLVVVTGATGSGKTSTLAALIDHINRTHRKHIVTIEDPIEFETIDIGLKAAETGHLVLSTVHTVDAATTISRLVSVFPAEEQAQVRLRLADNLKASISQRLLPRADGRGRVLAQEILVQTGSVQEHIRNPEMTSGIKDVLAKGTDTYGMQTFEQHLTQLFRQGLITLDAAKAAATNAADFERALHFTSQVRHQTES